MVKQRATPISAVLLAGGQSSRMGEDKAWVLIDHVPMAVRVLLRLVNQVDEILISANDQQSQENFQSLSYPIVNDVVGEGPLSGIYSAMDRMQYEWLFVSPCDVPNLPMDTINRLMQSEGALRYVHDGERSQHLCMLIHQSLKEAVLSQLHKQEYSVKTFIDKASGTPVYFNDCSDAFININSKEDLSRYE